jgi:hypothetical protein
MKSWAESQLAVSDIEFVPTCPRLAWGRMLLSSYEYGRSQPDLIRVLGVE